MGLRMMSSARYDDQELLKSAVRIRDEDGHRGTGFVFRRPDEVITCAHVVDYPQGHKRAFRPLPKVTVQSLTGSQTTATIDAERWSDQNRHDIALLTLAERLDDVNVFGVAGGMQLGKQRLHVVGTPKVGGVKWLEDWPELFGHTCIDERLRLQLSTSIQTPDPQKGHRGFSGGPVFAPSENAIVGMIVESPKHVRGGGDITNVMFAIPMETICEVAKCPASLEFDEVHYMQGVMASLIAIRRGRPKMPRADAILISGDLATKSDLNVTDEAEWAESLARKIRDADDREVVKFLQHVQRSDKGSKGSSRGALRDLVSHLVPWKYGKATRILLPTSLMDDPFILVPSVSDFIVEASHAAMYLEAADWQKGNLKGSSAVSPLVLAEDKTIQIADSMELQHQLARVIQVGEQFLKRRDASKLVKLALTKHRQRHRPPYIPLDPQQFSESVHAKLREQLIQFQKEFPEIDLLEKAQPDAGILELDQLYGAFIEGLDEEEK